jgi:uncharacterized membrane protein
MSLDDWLLALHVLSAFAFMAAIVLFWVLVVAIRRADTPAATIETEPVVKVGNVAVALGATGTIVLGVWLAISLDEHRIWDFWVIAAIVLWLLSGEAGRRTGVEYARGMEKAKELRSSGQTGPSAELAALNRTSRGVLLHLATTVLLVLIVLDMIWKPGA